MIAKLTEIEEEMFAELMLGEHNVPHVNGWVNFDPDFRQKDIARLLRRGWVERRVSDAGGRPHREYRITPAGRARLAEATR